MTAQTFTVDGMTCGHCVQAVTEEVKKLAGVAEVRIDLASGQVVVESDAGVTDDAMRAAVDEAGYTLASAP